MKDNLVSVIMPAYNCEKFISASIESVISQTYENWELLIVDDCSIDNTHKIVNQYASKDSRIKLFRQNTNLGVSHARNRAIKESDGRYIAFLDSDDIWKKEKIELQIEFMKKNNYPFTFTAYEIIKESGEKTNKIFEVPDEIKYDQYLKNTIIGCLTVVIDKKVIEKVYMPHEPLEDVLTWMEILKSGFNAQGLNENLALYRITGGSASSNKIMNAKKYYKLLRENQKLPLLYSLYCHAQYSINAIKKRIL